MTVNTLSDSVYTDFQGLSQLKYKASTDTPKALQEVGKHFEALFIQMMLKSMREATPDNPLFGDKAEELYRGLFDKQISMNIASNSKLGLADLIVRQLQHNVGTQNTTQNDAINDKSSTEPSKLTGLPGNDKSSDTQAALSPTKFVKDLWPYAKTAAEKLNVDPQVLVAQAALETGWGRGITRHPDGQSSNNLFGIKAGSNWQKKSVSVTTLEYRDGIAVKQQARFRSYDSLQASFQDYVNFLQNNPRYKEALSHASDPNQFTNALQDAGYATDPKYAEKINNILGGNTLASALADLKLNQADPIA